LEWIAGGMLAAIVALILSRMGSPRDNRVDLSGSRANTTMPLGASPAPPRPQASARDMTGTATPGTVSDVQLQAIDLALSAGNKIEAIKLLREATGLGLKEAKDAIEAMERHSRR
jgi:ribosomal protein L7/L12